MNKGIMKKRLANRSNIEQVGFKKFKIETTPCLFLQTPADIQHIFISYLGPIDQIILGQTCKYLQQIVRKNIYYIEYQQELVKEGFKESCNDENTSDEDLRKMAEFKESIRSIKMMNDMSRYKHFVCSGTLHR